MPTQYSKKHTNETSMSLWRASTIHHLMVEQINTHIKSAKKVSEPSPVPAGSAQRRPNIGPDSIGKRYGIGIGISVIFCVV